MSGARRAVLCVDWSIGTDVVRTESDNDAHPKSDFVHTETQAGVQNGECLYSVFPLSVNNRALSLGAWRVRRSFANGHYA